MKISVVIPVYNEQLDLAEVLAKYITDLKNICAKEGEVGGRARGEYEVIVVNDGSTDGSLKILADSARVNRSIRVINLDGRFGKQAAITAGMQAATGDCVVLADIDILNPVGVLSRVYNEFRKGAHIVYAYRERNGFDRVESNFSDAFTRFACKFFGVDGKYMGRPRVALYSRDVADIINELPQKNKFLRTMDNWLGWEIKEITYASGYNKAEERVKARESAVRIKKSGEGLAPRDKTREHSGAKAYALAFTLIAIAVFMSAVVLTATIRIDFIYYVFLWLVVVLVFLMTVLFHAKAVLIKRVGVLHGDSVMEIYRIKNTIN